MKTTTRSTACPPMDSDGAIALDAHLQDLHRRNLSAATMRLRSGAVQRFAQHLAPRPLLSAGTADIEAWIDAMVSRGLRVSTRRIYQIHVRLFFRWAHRRGLVAADPTTEIVLPVVHAGVPRPIGEQELRRAISAADGELRAWLVLGAYCGLRAGEIARLCREDVVDTERPARLIVACGKGGRSRSVPLSEQVLAELRPHLRGRRGRLWLDGLGYPESPVSTGVGEHLRALGMPYTCHGLRHRFGTQLYQRSRDLRMTQAMLGHASPITTQVYADWDRGRGVEIIEELGGALGAEDRDDRR